MSKSNPQKAPTTRALLKATGLAIALAVALLVAVVLPAEYGVDPTGIGSRLGVDVLSPSGADAESSVPIPATQGVAGANDDPANIALAAKAEVAFGKADGQSLDAHAVSLVSGPFRRSSAAVTLDPGKGAEIKAQLLEGEGLVFHWTASADVAVDMHGERPGAKSAWTSYAVEAAQREASGTFVAPFEGSHGWYWKNLGTAPVTVQIEAVGFQPDLHRP